MAWPGEGPDRGPHREDRAIGVSRGLRLYVICVR